MQYKLKPWDHQLVAIGKAIISGDFAFLFEMGCGKTGACINTLRHIYAHFRLPVSTLVIGPLITLTNWKREFGMHSYVDSSSILVLNTGAAKDKLKKFLKFIEK